MGARRHRWWLGGVQVIAMSALMVIGGAVNYAAGKTTVTPRKVVVAKFELVQTAPEDQRYDEAQDQKRLILVTRLTRQAYARSPQYNLLARNVNDNNPPYSYLACKACIYDWGRQVGADLIVVGWVQKVSRLILNMNVAVLDVRTHSVSKLGSVSLRDDTDRMWRLGIDYVLKNQLLTQPASS